MSPAFFLELIRCMVSLEESWYQCPIIFVHGLILLPSSVFLAKPPSFALFVQASSVYEFFEGFRMARRVFSELTPRHIVASPIREPIEMDREG
jgi:hypothetical protein